MTVVERINRVYELNVLDHVGPRNKKHAEAVAHAALILRAQGLTYQQIGIELNRESSSVYRAVQKLKAAHDHR